MPVSQPTITRRALLGVVALMPLVGCTTSDTSASLPPKTSFSTPAQHDRLVELERTFDARLGVFALNTAAGTTLAYRADERFAFCSMFKALAAAAVLHRHPMEYLDKTVSYSKSDLMKHSPVTQKYVAQGMTIRQLCDAAIRYSDGTAGNLLVRDLGGPDQLTAYVRSLGDDVTRMDRVEPAITEAVPGDVRDTTSPRAFAGNFHKIVAGDALSADKRDFLRDLLERNTTGDKRIRAGVPQGWKVADKTGSGSYGTANDTAVIWPPNSAPVILSIMSSKASQDADYDEALIAEAAAYVVDTLS